MRTWRYIVASTAAVVGMAVINGCDALENATQIDVPITVTMDFTGTGNVAPKTVTDCTDLSTNKDFNDNKSKITGGSVKEAYIRLTNLSGLEFSNPAVNAGNAMFTNVRFDLKFDAVYNDPTVYNLGSFSNVKLSDLVATGPGTGYKIPINNAEIDRAVKLLKVRPKFCIVSTYGSFQNATTGTAPLVQGQMEITFKFEVDAL
jgi:hypothetical protein